MERFVRGAVRALMAGGAALLLIAVWAAAASGVLLVSAPAALAVPPTQVVVEDTAGALYRPQLDPALAKISFYEPTKVVVFTRAGAAADNLNEEVLRYARANHPEWISPDGQKWADGLFIFALDTTGRHVGTYFGEDRKVSLDEQKAIQDDTKDLFRAAQWTDGTIAGVKSAASRIGRPWYLSPAAMIGGGIAGVAVLGGAGAWAGVRAWRRRKFAEALSSGDRSYSSVTLALDTTELNASTIPASSSYGGLVLERWEGFRAKHREATSLRDRLTLMTPRERSRSTSVKEARKYEELAQALDGLDDAIADTNAILNRGSSWRSAWQRQTQDLTGELDGVDAMLAAKTTAGTSESARALASGVGLARAEIERLGAGLEDGSLTPEAALDGLKAQRERIGALLGAHAEAVIDEHAKSQKERDLMRGKLEASTRSWRSTHRTQGSILDVAYPQLPVISIVSFNSGIAAGYSAVDSARSSSSTGYGSSGGSFSGSGSSSSF
ncbi:hypothetical protein SA2016_0045 [Sinomonas atrocyanea]|uniref:DUF5129 domain-containing protein n=1 Tax=Sinomonas atrocyanea TaxID=37927 RepID=A0A126ZUC6_9MICC|nr:DUF5129 domain-containing protein [Sinomonas atrocyanea]AMM30750.1 hypothetical protein SA2016_0045 [Sinomonas atrocyanea]GEB63796.1 hypothetical protein SAT01_12440 [Sinomonas atrocyanea]GGG74262.1 hypothetical protein GCM10007172_28730 [Sinomonas atrocyanea]